MKRQKNHNGFGSSPGGPNEESVDLKYFL